MKKIFLALAALACAYTANAQTIKVYETLGDTTILKYQLVNDAKHQYKFVIEETDPNYKSPEYDYTITNSYEAPKVSSDKEMIEETILKLISLINANDFKPMMSITEDVMPYETDSLKKWTSNTVKSLKKVLGIDQADTTSVNEAVRIYQHMNIEWVADLAQFTGKFTVEEDQWKYVGESNDLEFAFRNMNGDSIVIRLEHSDKSKRMYMAGDKRSETNYDEEYAEEYEAIPDTIFHVNSELKEYAAIPEEIHFSYVKEQDTLLNVHIEVDLSQIKEDGMWDLSKHKLASKQTATFCGYTFVHEIATNAAEAGPHMGLNIYKNGEQLIAMGADLGGFIDYNPDLLFAYDYNPMDQLNNLTSLKYTINILGWLQAEINTADYNRLMELYEHIRYAETEEEMKLYANRFNQLIKGKIYYNGSTKEAASIYFEAIEVEDEEDFTKTKLTAFPAIKFADGSSYALFDYFDPKKFENVLDAIEQLEKDFKKLIRGEDEEERAELKPRPEGPEY